MFPNNDSPLTGGKRLEPILIQKIIFYFKIAISINKLNSKFLKDISLGCQVTFFHIYTYTRVSAITELIWNGQEGTPCPMLCH